MNIGAAVGIGAAQAGFNMLGGLVNNGISAGMQNYARHQNYLYNEKSAANADIRARAMYNDLMSPKALLQQYKEAGLSPSLMFGGGGVGGQTPQGAQGEGASGVSPQTYGINPIDLSQIKLANAQAENIKADTDLKKAETEVTQEKVNNLVQDTKNKYLQGENMVIQNMMSQIDLSIKGEYGERKVQKELDILNYKAEQMTQELRKLVVEGNISEETQETIIKYYFDKTQLQVQEIALKAVQGKLTQEQINDLVSQQVTRKNLYALKSEEVYQNFLLGLQELGIKKEYLNLEDTKLLLQEIKEVINLAGTWSKGGSDKVVNVVHSKKE